MKHLSYEQRLQRTFVHVHETTMGAWNSFVSDARQSKKKLEAYQRCCELRNIVAGKLVLAYNEPAIRLSGEAGEAFLTARFARYQAYENWTNDPTCPNAHARYEQADLDLRIATHELALLICKDQLS